MITPNERTRIVFISREMYLLVRTTHQFNDISHHLPQAFIVDSPKDILALDRVYREQGLQDEVLPDTIVELISPHQDVEKLILQEGGER
jgi:hypothetical protein